jgi:hypothetical protein
MLRKLSIPSAKATANPAVSDATAKATDRDTIGKTPLNNCCIGAVSREPIKGDSVDGSTLHRTEAFLHHGMFAC